MMVFSLEDGNGGIHSPSRGFCYVAQDDLELTMPVGFKPAAILHPFLLSTGITVRTTMPTAMLALRMEVSTSVSSPVIRQGYEGNLRSEIKGIQSVHTAKTIEKSI